MKNIITLLFVLASAQVFAQSPKRNPLATNLTKQSQKANSIAAESDKVDYIRKSSRVVTLVDLRLALMLEAPRLQALSSVVRDDQYFKKNEICVWPQDPNGSLAAERIPESMNWLKQLSFKGLNRPVDDRVVYVAQDAYQWLGENSKHAAPLTGAEWLLGENDQGEAVYYGKTYMYGDAIRSCASRKQTAQLKSLVNNLRKSANKIANFCASPTAFTNPAERSALSQNISSATKNLEGADHLLETVVKGYLAHHQDLCDGSSGWQWPGGLLERECK